MSDTVTSSEETTAPTDPVPAPEAAAGVEGAGEGPVEVTPGKPVAFDFQHGVLTMAGSVFTWPAASDRPMLQVRYGDVCGSVSLDQVRTTFGIKADSPDGRLLSLVERSLRHVQSIRPGDRIPSEILDGTASWTVEDRHRDMAWLKLTTALLAQLGVTNLTVAETEQAKAELRRSADVLAARIGLPPGSREEAVDRAERLAAELGYIEALRDFYKPLFELPWKLKEIQKANGRDQQITYDTKRTQELLKVPMGRIRAALDSVDARMADLVTALAEPDKTVKLIRSRRDVLHYQSMDWQAILTTWRTLRPATNEAILSIAELIRFLSLRFVQVKSWA
ncbi:MAG: hypothetical protein RLY86_3237 [Pseudomonadota bacterium]|jgi:hypothetical protein